MHQDATNLVDVVKESFDFVVVSHIIHELDAKKQQQLIDEVWRVGRNHIFVDANVPLPWNVSGLIKRAIEITFGLDHYPQFRAYLASGGLMGILKRAKLIDKVIHHSLFSLDCIQIVVSAHQ